jgi:signal transduction histidine kinase
MSSLPTSNPPNPELAVLRSRFLEEGESLAGGQFESDGVHDEQFLLCAFRSFAQAAETLERSYGLLRLEVDRLRRELEESNSGLARSLEENRSMREHLDCILEGLPCGVLVTTGSGEISRMNPEALRLLGVDGGLASQSISNLRPEVQLTLKSAREHCGELESPIVIEGEAARWLSARHATIGNASVFILRDITERKRFEKQRETFQRQEALAQMSAVLAHEMRNPLGSLELFAGLLAESDLGGERKGWIEQVQVGLRTLSATVNNVLHFHSLPEGERTAVDLGQLLDWAAMFFVPVARQARVELSLHNRLRGVVIQADRHRLEQVLLNLVLNAIRAMPGGGWIELAGCRVQPGRAASIVVADTGPGIPASDLDRIFEAGFSTRAGSPGLGLAVCRKIVEQQGGNISAECEPGRGAKFSVILPLASAEAQQGVTA